MQDGMTILFLVMLVITGIYLLFALTQKDDDDQPKGD